MPGGDSQLSPVRAYLTPKHGANLLVVLVISCLLMMVTIQLQSSLALIDIKGPTKVKPSRPRVSGDTEGRHRGRPISGLWATNLPEQAWFSNPQCQPLITRFTCDYCLPLVYLASFPRSGNTWTRYLLEASTGLFTGSGGPNYQKYRAAANRNFTLTNDGVRNAAKPGQSELVDMGYRGENMYWTQGITVVTKTHFLPEPWGSSEADSIEQKLSPFPENATRRAVLLIRDPFKSFISLRKYGATQSVLNDKDMARLFQGEEWEQFAIGYAQIWFDMNARWIESTNETHVIAYERLTKDPIGELTELLRFIDIEPDPRRMECIRLHLEGKAHNRHHGVVPDLQTYPLLLRAKLWSLIHQLNWLLLDRGYPTLPLESYSFAEEFSDIYIGV